MKKLLLSLAMAVGMVSVAGAVEVTDVLNQALVGNSGTSYSEYTVASSKTESGAAYALQCAGDKSSIQLRSKNNNSGVVSTTSGGTLKKVVVTWNSGTAAARVLNIYAADEAFTIAGLYGTSAPTPVATMTCSEATDGVSTYTFEADYKYIAFRSADGAMYLTSIAITWETGQAAAAVDKPVIMAEGATVTIEAGATGADAIYYTINGDDPTTESTKYTEPFTVEESCTVKAVAQKGTDLSAVASYDVKVVKHYESYASFLATDPGQNTEAIIDGPITAIHLNGSNLYTMDSKGSYMLLFDYNAFKNIDVKNGTQFASVQGAYSPYYGIPEMKDITLGAQSEGTAVEPKLVEALTSDLINAYIKIEGVDITEGEGSGATFDGTKGETSLVIYNSFGVEVPTGKGFTVIGIVSVKSDVLQILPLAFEGGESMETVADPEFSVASGRVTKGAEVTLTCATPEAQIFFTYGDAVPDSESTLYEEPFEINEATTINAIAYKDGMLASQVVSVSYTILPDGTKTGSFDFTAPADLTPAVTVPEVGKGIEINGQTFTSADGVSLAFSAEGTASTKTRIWNPSGASAGKIDLRIYNGWSFTVTAPEGYVLSAIDLTYYNSFSYDFTASVGEMTAAGSWEMPAAAPAVEADAEPVADGKSVTFTAKKTNNIATMNVYYVAEPESGIESVVAADENAPVEYYNLQGVRVANPTAGLYIVKQGSKVSKAIIR